MLSHRGHHDHALRKTVDIVKHTAILKHAPSVPTVPGKQRQQQHLQQCIVHVHRRPLAGYGATVNQLSRDLLPWNLDSLDLSISPPYPDRARGPLHPVLSSSLLSRHALLCFCICFAHLTLMIFSSALRDILSTIGGKFSYHRSQKMGILKFSTICG